jgi:lipopolysaccharide/colanic/teichoic acid biosynthesis glycosyltransferase
MSSPPTAGELRADARGIPRFVETGLAGLGIVLCAPVLAGIALVVRISSTGPVLFRQRRVGLGGREFTLLKFRTMRVNQDAAGATASGDPRITPVGRWLRHFKLDELPELWNVLRGDMSLVGPRPELPGYVDLSDPGWRAVLRTRPGITDPVTLRLRNEEQLMAKAPGRPEVFYREVLQPYKLAGYLEYQQRRSFPADIMVIVRTIGAVLVPGAMPPPSIETILAANRASAGAPDAGVVPGRFSKR